MRVLVCVVAVAGCRRADPPAREPEPVATTATADASQPSESVDASVRSPCLDVPECGDPCVSIDGKVVELPPVRMAHVKNHEAEADTPAFTTFTIKLFDEGPEDCARRDYDALLSTSDGRLGFTIGTISWGGMMQVTDIRLADKNPYRMTLCVAPTTLHMDGQPYIVVAGAFAAGICE